MLLLPVAPLFTLLSLQKHFYLLYTCYFGIQSSYFLDITVDRRWSELFMFLLILWGNPVKWPLNTIFGVNKCPSFLLHIIYIPNKQNNCVSKIPSPSLRNHLHITLHYTSSPFALTPPPPQCTTSPTLSFHGYTSYMNLCSFLQALSP